MWDKYYCIEIPVFFFDYLMGLCLYNSSFNRGKVNWAILAHRLVKQCLSSKLGMNIYIYPVNQAWKRKKMDLEKH
jgi:hypothetical protein